MFFTRAPSLGEGEIGSCRTSFGGQTQWDLRAEDQLDFLKGKEREALAKAKVFTVADLLAWFPKRYEDRRQFDAFPAQAGGDALCLRGLVIDSMQKRFGGTKGYYEVVLEAPGEQIFSGGTVACRWFNMPFVSRMVAVGHEVIVYGRVKDVGGRMVIEHPEFEIVSGAGSSLHLDRIVPIYKGISGIPQRRLRELIAEVLENVSAESLAIDYDVDSSYPREEAFREIHFPNALEQTEAARRRFALEEFFEVQVKVLWRRMRQSEVKGREQGKKTDLLKEFYHSLPFDLTDAQKRSIKEVLSDMRSPRAMNRLLQGDVGSGKT